MRGHGALPLSRRERWTAALGLVAASTVAELALLADRLRRPRRDRRGRCVASAPSRAALREAGPVEGVRIERGSGGEPSVAELEARLRAEGLHPFRWANGPGYRYEPHRHDFDSVIVCVSGSITFHVGSRDLELGPGDRIDLARGVEHAATVGARGVECLEATG